MLSSLLCSGPDEAKRFSLTEIRTRVDVVISEKLCQASARIAILPVKKKAINFRAVNTIFNVRAVKAVFSFLVIFYLSTLNTTGLTCWDISFQWLTSSAFIAVIFSMVREATFCCFLKYRTIRSRKACFS